MEVNGEDQVVAVETQNLSPVQMGTVKVSDLLAGLIPGNLDYCCCLLPINKITCGTPATKRNYYY